MNSTLAATVLIGAVFVATAGALYGYAAWSLALAALIVGMFGGSLSR